MCGILFTNDPNVNKKDFTEALYEMKHRGPDSPGGYVSYKNNKLGHNRSKIFNNNNDPMDQWLEFNIRTLNIEY